MIFLIKKISHNNNNKFLVNFKNSNLLGKKCIRLCYIREINIIRSIAIYKDKEKI